MMKLMKSRIFNKTPLLMEINQFLNKNLIFKVKDLIIILH